MSSGKCRDCGHLTTVENRNWGRASSPRCPACGGLLDRVGGQKPKYRTPSGKRVRAGSGSRTPDVNGRISL